MKKRFGTFILGVLATAIAAPAVAHNPLFGDGKSSHWGVVARNTIGSPVAALRDGPFVPVPGPAGDPPFGNGSLGIEVSDNSTTLTPPSEKVDFGDEVDFFGDPVLALNAVGFRVFQTGENAGISPTNMPNIRLEIDANLNALPADNFTTMVWVPDAVASINQWSGYIDAATTGKWYFTGAEGGATGCTDALVCDFAAAKAALNDGGAAPTVFSIAVGKGRDNRWVGAVDGLRLNSTIYDFEKWGVKARSINHH